MITSIDESKLKDLLKSAVGEALEEHRDLVRDIVEEAIEDLAMARAIDEGLATEPALREEVFAILESAK